MRTVRCSSHLPGVSAQWGDVCQVGGFFPEGCLSRGMVSAQESVCMGGVSQHALRQTPPCGQNSWHMLLKILPCCNFVVDGNKQVAKHMLLFQVKSSIWNFWNWDDFHGKQLLRFSPRICVWKADPCSYLCNHLQGWFLWAWLYFKEKDLCLGLQCKF